MGLSHCRRFLAASFRFALSHWPDLKSFRPKLYGTLSELAGTFEIYTKVMHTVMAARAYSKTFVTCVMEFMNNFPFYLFLSSLE